MHVHGTEHGESDPDVRSAKAAGSSPGDAYGVLALQQLAGNAAATAYLRGSANPGRPSLITAVQRQKPPAPTGTPEERFQAEITAGNWAQAAVLLNGFSDGDIAVRIATLTATQQQGLLTGCPEWAHRVRTPLLTLRFRAAVTDSNWAQAALLLNGFSDGDIATRTAALSTAQRTEVYAAAPGWATRILLAVTAADLAAAWAGDVRRADDWTRAALHLNGFSDADIASRLAGLTAAQQQGLLAGCPDWAHRVRTPLLDVGFRAAVTAGNWPQAALLLNGFGDADIASRITTLTSTQQQNLAAGCPEWAHRVRTPLLNAQLAVAIAAGEWPRACLILNGFSDGDILSRITALTTAQQQSLLTACPDWAHRVRTPLLNAQLAVAVAAGDWPRVGVLLNGYNDADISSRVVALSAAQQQSLLVACPAWIQRVRTPLLNALLGPPIAAGDWPRVCLLLDSATDAELAQRIGSLTPAQRKQLAASARRSTTGNTARIIAALHGAGVGAGSIFGTTTVSPPAAVNGTPTTRYAYPIEITFAPDPAVANSTEIAFIQTCRIADIATNTSFDTRPGFSGRLTPGGTSIDRLHGRESAFYGYDNGASPGGTVTPGSSPTPLTNAKMTDRASFNRPNTQWTFEASVVPRVGPDAGLVYSVVTWGFTVDAALVVTSLPRTQHDTVSAEFNAAAGAWNAQAGGPAAGRNDPGQQALPALR